MEVEAPASKVCDTSTTPTASSLAPNGSNPGTPETTSAMTQKEILRERYLKGVKKRKCAVCGNTARARCPFRACKTCCNKMKNACEIHANKPKQASNSPSLHPHDPRWAAAMNAMPYGSPYARSPYMSSAAYNSGQVGTAAYKVGYPSPHSRAWTPGQYTAQNARPYMPPQATLEQQELQRLKNLKAAILAANREAQITQSWRTQKMREFTEGELLTEDEAFDRYMFNMALLEEVFLPQTTKPMGLSPDGKLLVGGGETLNEIDDKDVSDTLMVVDGLRLRRAMNATRKEASRSRLKTTIDRSLQALKRGPEEVDDLADDEDYMQGLLLGRRRDLKRFKATSKEGKDCLKRIDLFDTLLQKTSQIHSRADIESCGEMYRQNFGPGLDVLLPHLSRNVENVLGGPIREISGDTATPSETVVRGDMPKEASTSSDSQATPAAADYGKDKTSEELQYSRETALDIDLKDSGEQDRHINKLQEKSSPHVKWKGVNADSDGSRLKVEEWPRLHKGFLAGHGWWKVEVDEQSAQIVCHHLISNQAVEIL